MQLIKIQAKKQNEIISAVLSIIKRKQYFF